MRKKISNHNGIVITVLLLALCVGLPGCAPKQPMASSATAPPKETAAPTSTPEEKVEASPSSQSPAPIRVAALKGPTALGLLGVMEKNENKETANPYSFSVSGTADEIATGIAKNEIDIAALPCNLASVLYNKAGQIQTLAVNTLGVLYLLEDGDTIQSIADLKGKTIYSAGKGTTPDFSLRYVLQGNGLDPDKDVNIEFRLEATELAGLLSAGKATVALLPEPYVTTVLSKNPKLRIALDLTQEWQKISPDAGMITGVLVARKAFLDQNKDAADKFLAEYKTSIAFANEQTDKAAALSQKFDIVPEAVAKQAIPRCNITYLDGAEMKKNIEGYLKVLYSFNPQSVGGKLPDENFYYQP